MQDKKATVITSEPKAVLIPDSDKELIVTGQTYGNSKVPHTTIEVDVGVGVFGEKSHGCAWLFYDKDDRKQNKVSRIWITTDQMQVSFEDTIEGVETFLFKLERHISLDDLSSWGQVPRNSRVVKSEVKTEVV